MVATSVHKLLEVDVLLMEFSFRHLDVREDLAKQSLKLKFRMNGITYMKSSASKAARAGHERPRISLGTAALAVFEGGDALDFELCRPQLLGSSRTVASCKTPLTEVLRSTHIDSPDASVWDLDMLATGTPNKVVGSLVVEVRIRKLKLYAAGGLEALKGAALPQPPAIATLQSAVECEQNEMDCQAFAEKASKAERRLQEAFSAAMRARGRVLEEPQGNSESAVKTGIEERQADDEAAIEASIEAVRAASTEAAAKASAEEVRADNEKIKELFHSMQNSDGPVICSSPGGYTEKVMRAPTGLRVAPGAAAGATVPAPMLAIESV